MTKSRIITQITPSGTTNYIGFDAENHLEQLGLTVKPLTPNFIEEVMRKVKKTKNPENNKE